MTEPITIASLELENIKRIKLVELTPSPTGLTVIGGRNGQGKTSVLDAIAYTLGGAKFRPSSANRDGAADAPHLKVTLSNGIIVERKGKNSTLAVTDPSGKRAGQALLDSFLSVMALDLPRFMTASDKEKAETLLQIIGVKDQLLILDRQEKTLYNDRLYTGREAESQRKLADGLPFVEGAPAEPVSAAELIQRQQSILLRNAENQRKREQLSALLQQKETLTAQLDVLKEQLEDVTQSIVIAQTSAAHLVDESTAELEEQLKQVDEINRAVDINRRKLDADQRASELSAKYDSLTAQITAVRNQRQELLNAADLPLPELSVQDGILLYKGKAWDCMSGSEQLRVAAAIVRRLNPACGFVLLDKLEQMDVETLQEFGAWLQSEGLQAIATRVSTGSECSVIIEDGWVRPAGTNTNRANVPAKSWTAGKF